MEDNNKEVFMNKDLLRLRFLRLGAILGNYAILGGVILFLLGLLPIATFIFLVIAIFIYLIIVFAWLLTFGQLFDFPSTSLFEASGPVYEAIQKFSHATAPYLFAFTAAFAIISIIIAAACKGRHVGRIVCSSIMLFFAVLGMVLIYTVGGITL